MTQTYTMGLILSDTANTPVFHTPLACAEQAAGILAKRQMRLEMLLNTKFTWQPDTRMTLYNELRACDEGLLKYDAGAKRDKSMVCLSSESNIFQSMQFPSPLAPAAHGKTSLDGCVTRQDVLHSIDMRSVKVFDQGVFSDVMTTNDYQESCMEDAQLYERITSLNSMYVKLPFLLRTMHKFRSLQQLAVCVVHLNQLRLTTIDSIFDAPPTAVRSNAARETNKQQLFNVLNCIDNCIMHNINALYGTESSLHDICLHQHELAKLTRIAPTWLYIMTMQDTMHLRSDFSHTRYHGKMLQTFTVYKSAITRQLWKAQVLQALETHYHGASTRVQQFPHLGTVSLNH